MGNCHVFLRIHHHTSGEPFYASMELNENIKWSDMQQKAFEDFKPYYAQSVDPSDLSFKYHSYESNVELVIADGETLRGLFEEFAKMDRNGHPAVLDVHVTKPGYPPHHQQDKTSKEHIKKEVKHAIQHAHKGKVKEEVVEVEFDKFYEKHQEHFKHPQHKDKMIIKFKEEIIKS
eukprot:TRINITY_DN2832_c1_g1_i1.p2 TRINITY_DN2832_c1_g1~~TRINITY_DN2832_c1_g1_i1.p2  ORF type:complete len:175 (-),score=20.81 TRINITY_DN2832_c1_g1_i1:199-723(-)